jgi:sugar lactone lactonase YvrE
VVDAAASLLRVIRPAGEVVTLAGAPDQTGTIDGTASFGRLDHPRALFSTPGGYVYIADTGNQTIRQFYPQGNGVIFSSLIVTLAGSAQIAGASDGIGTAARFHSPAGIAVSPGYVTYVADTANHRIVQIVQATAAATTIAGAAGISGSTDGPALSARFNAPAGIAVDGAGNVFVADTGNNMIRKLSADGTVSTFAGVMSAGLADGVGAGARFNQPTALAFDALGNLWVADTGNNAIRRIAPSSLVTTVVSDGLAAPSGIAFDSNGTLYIADRDHHVIRVAVPAAPAPPQQRRRAVRH